MQRRPFLTALATLAAAAAGAPSQAAPAPAIHVYKDPDCGCCAGWVEHLQANGFQVGVTATDDTAAVRARLGMPDRLGSCHTATVGSYVLEGHVPAAEIKRLLAGQPDALGLAVPSMPVGSPGMESGTRKDPFEVFLVRKDGSSSVFARYPKA